MRTPRKTVTKVLGQTSSTTTMEATNDHFLVFTLERDLEIEQFVALTIEWKVVRAEVPFYMEKVVEFRQSKWAIKVKVI